MLSNKYRIIGAAQPLENGPWTAGFVNAAGTFVEADQESDGSWQNTTDQSGFVACCDYTGQSNSCALLWQAD